LAGIELDDFAAGLSRFLDRLESCEAVKGIGLATEDKASDTILGSQRGFRTSGRERGRDDRHKAGKAL
jgi:hypothetical protein